MYPTRRQLLHSLALTGAAAAFPRFAFAQQPGPNGGFPPQAQIDADALRPRYHLSPKHGWMNDPCAPVYFNGRYHLFFQDNPKGSVWGNMSWAHAVSKDMVHWSLRPVALQPTPGGPDSFGVFTGSMVFDKPGIPTILYTCVSPSSKGDATLWNSNPPEREAQCIATPTDVTSAHPKGDADSMLDRWSKRPEPVIAAPPPEMKVTGFRDPVPWREADGNYYLLLASGQKGVGGNVLLYKSPDLRAWEYQGIFAEGKPTGQKTDDTVDSGETWECPDFFPLGGKHVLIHSEGTSQGRTTKWQSGTLDKATMQWTPEKQGVLNHGPYYAPKTQLDAHGNRILWGWIPETWSEAEMTKHGWSGCMSLPRVLTLVDGEVLFTPAYEVKSLRSPLEPGSGSASLQAEFVFHLATRGARAAVRGAKPMQATPQAFRNAHFNVETSSDPAMNAVRLGTETVPLPADMPQEFDLRVFLDGSVVEVFVGNRVVLTHRVYDGTPTILTLPHHYNATPVFAYSLSSLA